MNVLTRLEIDQPIFLAPMAGTSTPELAAAVSNAGGLGSLGLGAMSVSAARNAIMATRKLTDQPFQVNFFCHQPSQYDHTQAQQWMEYLRPYFTRFSAQPPQHLNAIYPSFVDNDDALHMVLEQRPKAVSFHFGLPTTAQLSALKQAGIVTMVSVSQLSEAILAEQAGIDILIAQGIEAGGHRASFNPRADAGMSTLDLFSLLKQHSHLPIVVAGGIMTGQDIADYLKRGASAAQLGTAFVQCQESAANDAYREALFQQPLTQITDSISGRAARGLINHWQLFIDFPERPPHAGYPFTYDLAKQLHSLASQQGEHGFAAHWAGAQVAKIRRLDAPALMQTLIKELDEAL